MMPQADQPLAWGFLKRTCSNSMVVIKHGKAIIVLGTASYAYVIRGHRKRDTCPDIKPVSVGVGRSSSIYALKFEGLPVIWIQSTRRGFRCLVCCSVWHLKSTECLRTRPSLNTGRNYMHAQHMHLYVTNNQTGINTTLLHASSPTRLKQVQQHSTLLPAQSSVGE